MTLLLVIGVICACLTVLAVIDYLWDRADRRAARERNPRPWR